MMTIESYTQDGFTRYSVGDDKYAADDCRRKYCKTKSEAVEFMERQADLAEMEIEANR